MCATVSVCCGKVFLCVSKLLKAPDTALSRNGCLSRDNFTVDRKAALMCDIMLFMYRQQRRAVHFRSSALPRHAREFNYTYVCRPVNLIHYSHFLTSCTGIGLFIWIKQFFIFPFPFCLYWALNNVSIYSSGQWRFMVWKISHPARDQTAVGRAVFVRQLRSR
jgi:hypothetical protein